MRDRDWCAKCRPDHSTSTNLERFNVDGKTHLLSEVDNLHVSKRRSVSCTKWASFKVSLPKRSVRHSKSEIPAKLGNPARLKSAIQSLESKASKRTVPSWSGAVLLRMVCLRSWCEGRRSAMFSTRQIKPIHKTQQRICSVCQRMLVC